MFQTLGGATERLKRSVAPLNVSSKENRCMMLWLRMCAFKSLPGAPAAHVCVQIAAWCSGCACVRSNHCLVLWLRMCAFTSLPGALAAHVCVQIAAWCSGCAWVLGGATDRDKHIFMILPHLNMYIFFSMATAPAQWRHRAFQTHVFSEFVFVLLVFFSNACFVHCACANVHCACECV